MSKSIIISDEIDTKIKKLRLHKDLKDFLVYLNLEFMSNDFVKIVNQYLDKRAQEKIDELSNL